MFLFSFIKFKLFVSILYELSFIYNLIAYCSFKDLFERMICFDSKEILNINEIKMHP